MKINFILPFTYATGGIRVAFEYANRLQEKGHDVVCYAPMLAYKFDNYGVKGNLRRIKSSIGNSIKRRNKVNWFDLNVQIKLVPYIGDTFVRKADAVIATAWPTAYSVYELDKDKGEKFYFVQAYEDWSGPKELVDTSYRLDLQHITISNELRNLLMNNFDSPRVHVVHNGNDFGTENIRKGFKKGTKILMMYHELELKGYIDGLKAFEIVKKKYPHVELTLFGTSDNAKIPDYAKFYKKPNRKTLSDLYSNNDIYIFPSRYEGWGLTAVEAMSCQCAVVGTNVGCMKDIGEHQETALLSEPYQIEEMAKTSNY